jgi:Uma2 family endonuclease
MGQAERIPHYTAEEYLALERAAEYKSELVNGVIYPMGSPNGEAFAMAGATRNHSLVVVNAVRLLSTHLLGRPCEVYTGEMRVKVTETGMYTYPDVVVACGDIQFDDDQFDTLINPTVIIEVLSPSTEAYDRGAKFGHYRQLESLQEYVLIAQDRVSVERFARQGEFWLFTAAEEMGETMRLESIGCELRLADVYERVEFGGGEAEEQDRG